jgi:ribosomal protein S18 acetylase RimI-like enzyme
VTTLRPLREDDLPELLAIQHAHAGGGPRWSVDELRHQLYDDARDRGRRAVVAARGGEAVGVAGWVEALPFLYGAPVLALDESVARPLIGHLVARAREIDARSVRISATPGEPGKRAALLAAGFEAAFDFVTVVRSVRPGDGAVWAGEAQRVAFELLDDDLLVDVHNETFDGLPNSPALTAAQLREQLDAPLTDRAATAAWKLGERYVAFVQVSRDVEGDTPFVTIDAIGVRAELRGRRIAQAILEDVLARSSVAAREARALIASTNTASLALHASRGFAERSRRTVFDLGL